MPRQKEFDVDVVCDRALDLFWRRGYEATSVADLVDELGIGKASLYAAFGPKHELYLTALRRYVERADTRIVGELGSDGSPLAAVRALVNRHVDQALDRGELGCLVVNAAVELMPSDPEVARLVEHSWDTIEVALTVTLTRAVAAGELPESSDPPGARRVPADLPARHPGHRQTPGHRRPSARRSRDGVARAGRELGRFWGERFRTKDSRERTVMGARFAGKVVLVTGASAGIGRTTAIAFAREDATVVVSGRSTEGLAGTVKEIEAIGGRVDSIVAEISDAAQVANLVEEIVLRHGRLDIAVNNAGAIGPRGPIDLVTDDEFVHLVNTNVIGTWLCMKHEVARMREQGRGVIVNLGSVVGTALSRPGLTAYATSKAAVAAMTRGAAREHIADGIRINLVSPGSSDTPMSLLPGETLEGRAERVRGAVPIGRIATTDEIANAVLWLASEEASFAVGHNLIIDGGAAA